MTSSAAALLARRDLLYTLTWREIKMKYKQSVMGMLWAVLMPAVIVSAGIVVRLGFSRLSGTRLAGADMASVCIRAVPWSFFVATIRFGASSLIGNSNLVTKIYLPREIFPVAAMLSQLVDFAVASLVLGAVLIALRVGISVQLLWVPVLIAILVTLATGLAIVLSAASLFFRDVKYLVEVVLTFAIFFTPVFYDASIFGQWSTLLMLNPVTPILEGFANTIARHTPPPLAWLGYSAGVAILLLAGAVYLFRRLEPYFAESV